ncbi:MAG: SDR family oxidoreductase [Rhodobacterales bacterium]|nr:SDR family oxidoreductase [Rhodobacterales bacterium]
MITLITGCRSGFGLLTAVEAARAGHTVYAGLRDLSTADGLRAASQGLDVRPIQLDVTDNAQIEAVVAQIIDEHGRIDALVNNAGIALAGFMEQLEEDEIRKLFDVNVFGVWSLTKAVLPHMRRQRGGHIVMVSSMASVMALPGLTAYASSKFALEGMSEGWRHELRPFGIQVALVEPGPYKTDILERNRGLCRNAQDPTSPYAPMVQRVLSLVDEKAGDVAGDPQDVAVRIVKIIGQKRPSLRHPMGPGSKARIWLKSLAPFGVIERVLDRVVKLPKPPT